MAQKEKQIKGLDVSILLQFQRSLQSSNYLLSPSKPSIYEQVLQKLIIYILETLEQVRDVAIVSNFNLRFCT